MKMLTSIKTDISSIKDSLKSYISGIKARSDEMHDTLHEEVGTNSAIMDKLADKVEYLERYSRRENLIIKGIPETVNENVKDLVFENVLNVTSPERGWTNGDISAYHRLGKARSADGTPERPMPIIVCFACRDDNFLVLRNKKKLNKDIKIGDDLTWSQRAEIQREFDDGKIAFFAGGKLVVKNKEREMVKPRYKTKPNEVMDTQIRQA
jgi:hypothetical protein